MMTYRESLEWLYRFQARGIKLGLEPMQRLCEALGIDLTSGDSRRYIHVAGTNGKGSVCAMAASILCEAGKRTGLYTSPHLVQFRERIRLGANLVPEDHVAEELERIRGIVEKWEEPPTFFEITTALALAWFQRQHVRWMVLETGLGGRLDATNVVTPAISVITPIAMDHMAHLGGTLAEIAREKAGIIKAGVPVLTGPQPPEVEAILRETAEGVGAPLTVIAKPIPESWELALKGSHQRWNAALAFAALVQAGLRPEPRIVGQALRTVQWPGRFQLAMDGRVVIDGAHNPAAAERLVQTWREEFGDERCTLVVGVLADKDVEGTVRALLPMAARVICVAVRNNPRSMSHEELAKVVCGLSPESAVVAYAELAAAFQVAREFPERVLVTGSLFLAGEALGQLGLMEGGRENSAQ
jgi:dihydrofolate synthase / folylpolyglutamate synthase